MYRTKKNNGSLVLSYIPIKYQYYEIWVMRNSLEYKTRILNYDCSLEDKES